MSGTRPPIRPENGVERWLDTRLPIIRLAQRQLRRLPDAEEPELLVDLRRHPGVLPGHPDRHRHRAGDALRAPRRPGLRLGRAHHARRELRLADPLHARQRRLDVLHRRLHPHVPRPLLRLLQGAARGAVDPRLRDLPADDGHGLHGLRAALGPDELLRRDGDHQPVRRHPARRRQPITHLAVGRLRGRQPDAEPLLLAALPAAVRDRRRRRPAHLGAARAGQQQPDRRHGEVARRTPCPSTRTTR